MTPSQVLKEKGFCQGCCAQRGGVRVDWDDPAADAHCMFGAAYVAYRGDMPAYHNFSIAVEARFGSFKAAVTWADALGRTKEDVVLMLESIGH
jgi:hypothetical protein